MSSLASVLKNKYRTLFSISFLILVFYLSKLQSFLLFHTLVELFSVVVAFAVFIVTWNSRQMQDNRYLHLVGISYIFIGALDLLHTLTYNGMNVIPVSGYPANQFWIATRFLEAITLLGGFMVIKRPKQLSSDLIFLCYFLLSAGIVLSILVWHNFPVCFIEGQGQTSFKIYGEYVIIAILFLAAYLLGKNKAQFSASVYRLLLWSLGFTILSEFCFTLYISNFGTMNELGHYAKLIAFFLIYKANVETGFTSPTGLIFKNLKDSEEKYKVAEKQLNALNGTKDKLFSIIAHDLKNPFASLISFSELIQRSAHKLEREKIGTMAERMNASARQAYSLLENLLNWSRVQTGLLKPMTERIKVAELLAEACQLTAAVAQSKNIQVKTDAGTDLFVLADHQMAATVIRNLISNALKFSYPGTSIYIQAVQSADQVLFSITDYGVGIAEEYQQDLLELGNKFSATGTAAEKGTGLGLVLCREFVELNGGEIWLKSELGSGTTFYFSLPLSS